MFFPSLPTDQTLNSNGYGGLNGMLVVDEEHRILH